MINIGFVGAGSIAGAHAEAVGAVNGCRLVAVTDVMPDRASALAVRHGRRPCPIWKAFLPSAG